MNTSRIVANTTVPPVTITKNHLAFAEKYGSLRVMANVYNTCNFDEFLKGLRWLAAQEQACKGCRFGGGWSWWPDCPVRDCCIEKNVTSATNATDFPAKNCRKRQTKKSKKHNRRKQLDENRSFPRDHRKQKR